MKQGEGQFPDSYEALQPVPLLSVGLLSYAGDDGGAKGQSYRLSFDQDAGTAILRFRFPDAQGHWQWCADPVTLTLPTVLLERLKEGGPLAPTLRELKAARYTLADADPKRALFEEEIRHPSLLVCNPVALTTV